MIERIRQLWSEAAWLPAEVIGFDVDSEQALTLLRAAPDDLDAVSEPPDDQIETVFTTLATRQNRLLESLIRVPRQHYPLLENLTDRIEISLFHHRL